MNLDYCNMAATQGTTFKKENHHPHNLSDILWLLDKSQFEGDIFSQDSVTNKFLPTDGFKKKKSPSLIQINLYLTDP